MNSLCRSSFRYEDDMVPVGGPAIRSFQKKKGQQFKYVGKESTHAPSTLRPIPSGFFNRLAKLNSRKPSIRATEVESIYPAHANALHKAGLATSVFPTMGELWEKQDEKLEKNKERDVSVKKNRNVYFCVAYSRYHLFTRSEERRE